MRFASLLIAALLASAVEAEAAAEGVDARERIKQRLLHATTPPAGAPTHRDGHHAYRVIRLSGLGSCLWRGSWRRNRSRNWRRGRSRGWPTQRTRPETLGIDSAQRRANSGLVCHRNPSTGPPRICRVHRFKPQ